MPTLSSEFFLVQVLEGLNNLSALRNSEVSAFRSILKYNFITVLQSGLVAAKGRCPLREVPL